jgi:2-phospho-L-lactate guanylyltransferase
MLLDVLGALGEAGLLSSSFVISSSRRTLGLAKRAGAKAIREASDTGVNSAIEKGLGDVPADDVMVVPSDLPLLTATEIKGALKLRSSGVDVVVVPSMDFDGTNLLLFPRSNPLPLSFDRDSFWNHLEAASRRGLKVAVFSARGIRYDVDTISHLRGLAKERTSGRAVALARKLVHQ